MTELDFTAYSWFEIRGRGWVASISNGEDLPKGMSACDLGHRYVKIDGEEYWVTGVEVATNLTYNRSQSFALLVRGPRK